MFTRIKLTSSLVQCIILLCMLNFPHSDSSNVSRNQQSFKVRPTNSSVLEGGEVVLYCEINDQAGRVQWVKDGFAYVMEANGNIVGHPRWSISGPTTQGIYNLHIRNASLSDDGEYQCQAAPAGRNKAIRTNAKLTVLSPPQSVKISSHLDKKAIEIRQNESVMLECTVQMAKPAASIIWLRGNVQIKGGAISVVPVPMTDVGSKDLKLQKFDTLGSINITATPDDDNMTYSCEAQHPAIPAKKPMRASVKLSVLYPPGQPIIEGYVEGETLRRGHQVVLTCKSRGGNPLAQVLWYRNGEQVHSVYTTEGSISKNVYAFVVRDSDDKARYECQVTNIISVDPMKTHVDLRVLFAPTNVIMEGPTEAKAEEQVTITCTTENSNPASEIKWTVDNRKVNSTSYIKEAPQGGFITSSNITFNINKDAQRAHVVCHASNHKLSQTIVGTHQINVIYPPTSLEISGYEPGSNVEAGTVLKLSCTAISGNPAPTITWFKNDNKLTSTTTKQRDHSVTSELDLRINASDNKANIRCEASNSATAQQLPLSQSVNLNVHFLPDTVRISTHPAVFRAGHKGRLICNSTSSNPPAEMSWWKSGSPVSGTTTSTTEGLYGGFISTVELPLSLTQEMNGEEYTCQAKNPEIDRSVHDLYALNILYPPVFENLDPNELIGMEGEPFVISVIARANPTPISYTWTRDGLALSSGDAGSRILNHGSTLNITRLQRLDVGTYTCEARNKEGATLYNLNLTVQYPATIVRTSASGVIYPSNAEARLFCEVNGSPIGAENITWYKESSNVADMPDRYATHFLNKTSFLRIKNPGHRDVGEYRCNVNNGISNVTSDPILFITNFKPEMANTPFMKKSAVNDGADARLFCKAKGSPLPHFKWKFNGKTILPNATEYKYHMLIENITELYAQSILEVARVSTHDYGTYECIAENSMGRATEPINLEVTSPPDPPTDLEATNITHDSVTLVWKRGFDGGLKTRHQVRWRRVDESGYSYLDVPSDVYRMDVKHLALGTYYVFSIRALNEKGKSKFLPDLLKVQTLREAPPNELIVSEINSSYIIVIIIAVSACACLLIATPIAYTAFITKKKAHRSGINKSQTADMYAPSTVNGDTMTGELSSVSDEKSDVNFDANDYVDEGRKTAASTYLIDPTLPDYGKAGLEMQVHQGTLNRRSNHIPNIMGMDSPPQRTTAGGTLSASKSSYIGNPSPAPPSDVNFYSVEMESGRYMGYDPNPSPVPVVPASTILEGPGPGAYYPSLSPASGHHHLSQLPPQQHLGQQTLQQQQGTLLVGNNQHQHHHHHGSTSLLMGVGTLGTGVGGMNTGGPGAMGTLTRTRTLPRPVPPPDVTVMTAGTKSPLPPTVPPPPATFARAGPIQGHSLGHPLSTFTSTPQYSDIDGHLV